jgi:flagellar hook-basal body complex protein FliE
MKINPLSHNGLSPVKGNGRPENLVDSFKDLLNNALDKVNRIQQQADATINKFSTGEIEDIHQVMIAVEEANLALKLTIQVRNKILESYREIMRMQV